MDATLARTSRPPAVLCGVTAALFAAAGLAGTPEPVDVPTAPHAVTALAAGAAVAVVLTGGAPYRARAAAGTVCAVAVAAGCVAAVPHTVLTLVVWLGGLMTGGVGPFDVTPAWLPSAAYLTAVGAAGSLVVWLVVDRRRAQGRCAACGRREPAPPPPWSSLRIWAGLAVVGALPYGLLKLAWALGIRIGLTGHVFDDVTFTSPGFGDTVVLTALGVAVAIGMGRRITGWARPALVTIGGIGSLMLLPVGTIAMARLAQVALGRRTIDDPEIAPWAFLVVYGSFLVWGVALAVLTVGYARSTRGSCTRHGAGSGGSPRFEDGRSGRTREHPSGARPHLRSDA
jgi:hypothetical protein